MFFLYVMCICSPSFKCAVEERLFSFAPDLSVIGLLHSEPDRGIKAIAIHLKNNQVVEILSDGTVKQQVQGVTHFSGRNLVSTE